MSRGSRGSWGGRGSWVGRGSWGSWGGRGKDLSDDEAIAEALKAVDFRGFLCIEQDKHAGDMKATCQRYLNLMKEHLA